MREYLEGRSVEPHPQRWLILFVLCTSLVLVFVSVTSMNVALPTMQTALSATGSDLQWITDSYILTFAGLLVPFGALGDRLGRKEVLLAGIVVLGVFSTLAAFSTSAGEVILYRAAMGVGAALIMPATLSIVALGCLLYGIIEGPELGWRNPWVVGCFGGALAVSWGYVQWERRVRFPMLDPAYFHNRVFTLGAMTVTLTFFVLFGTFFILTQYFQFAQGHSPLGAGLRSLPPSGIVLLLAPRAPAVVARFGARATLTAALAIVAIGVAMLGTLSTASPYWLTAVALIVLATGLALIMPTATHAIVSSLPSHKSGVGSAVNDTTREAGGAIGIAVLGTLVSIGYRGGISGRLGDLPPAAAEAASDSVGGAVRAGGELPAEAAERLHVLAVEAFDRGMTLAYSVAAAVLLVAAAIVYRIYPKHRTFDGQATPAEAGAAAGGT